MTKSTANDRPIETKPKAQFGSRFALLLVVIGAVTGGAYFGRGVFASLLGDKPLPELLKESKSDNDQIRVNAILALGRHPEYLPDSLDGIMPNLIKSEELVRIAAERAVRTLGQDVVPHLKSYFEAPVEPNYYIASAAAKVLGPKAREYAPLLISRLDSPDFNTKMASLFALENMGKDAVPAVNALIKLLDAPNEEFNLHLGACRVLTNIGVEARPAIPRLIRLADEGILSSRSMACQTLGALGPSADHDIVGLLTKKLDAFYMLERERSLIGLASLGEHAAPARDKVVSLMNDSSKSVQGNAAYAYWRMTGDIETALKVLGWLLDSYDFREQAIQRLGDMGEAARPLVPKLIGLLREEESSTRESVVLTLGQIGPAASEAISRLEQMALNDQDLLIRDAAAFSVQAIKAK